MMNMRLSTRLRALRYETRNLGWVALAMPLLVLAGFGGLAGLLLLGKTQHVYIGDLLTAGVEAGLPLAAGVVVAGLLAQDASIELQLSLPTAYHRTVTRRFALFFVAAALVGAVVTAVLSQVAPWTLHKIGGDGQLMWLAPMVWFCGAGAVLALLTRSRAAAGAALGGIWVAELAFHDYFAAQDWAHPWFLFASLYYPAAPLWLSNRLELIGIGVTMLALAWLYLHNPEWRFRGEDVS
jgi:hypothetical protein